MPSILTSTNKLLHFHLLSRRLTTDHYVNSQTRENSNLAQYGNTALWTRWNSCRAPCLFVRFSTNSGGKKGGDSLKYKWVLWLCCNIKNVAYDKHEFKSFVCIQRFIYERILISIYPTSFPRIHNTTAYCYYNSKMKWAWSLWNHKLIFIKW